MVNVAIINRIGIGKATYLAMRDIVKNLRLKLTGEKTFVLVDGFYVKYIRGVGLKNQKGIVHGDEISLSIAAASIIAKVHRDGLMRKLSNNYPHYGWGRNKGYGSLEHKIALQKLGATRLHRTDFIENIIRQSSL
jgi:ribonuclease HII